MCPKMYMNLMKGLVEVFSFLNFVSLELKTFIGECFMMLLVKGPCSKLLLTLLVALAALVVFAASPVALALHAPSSHSLLEFPVAASNVNRLVRRSPARQELYAAAIASYHGPEEHGDARRLTRRGVGIFAHALYYFSMMIETKTPPHTLFGMIIDW